MCTMSAAKAAASYSVHVHYTAWYFDKAISPAELLHKVSMQPEDIGIVAMPVQQ